MSIICPKCGKDDVIPFSDSEFHTHGFECHTCNEDFGVDDGKTIKEYIDDLISIEYEKIEKDQTKKRLSILEENGKYLIKPSIVYPNKLLQPIEPQDISQLWKTLKTIIVEKLYILDWNPSTLGLMKGKDESYSLILKFKTKPTLTYKGINKFPPYLKALEQIFSPFFEIEQ